MLGTQMLRQLASYMRTRIVRARRGEDMMSEKLSAPIPQDTERFKLLFTNSRPKMPEGFKAPLDFKPTRTLIRERLESLRPAS